MHKQAWGAAFLVLRPNLLSIYRHDDETGLKHQVDLSEVSTVALRSSPRGKQQHSGLFGLFTPARNYYFDAGQLEEARSWIDVIRKEACLEEDEIPNSSAIPSSRDRHKGFDSIAAQPSSAIQAQDFDVSSSSGAGHHKLSVERSRPIPIRLAPAASESGNDGGSYSDFSDTPFGSAISLSPTKHRNLQSSPNTAIDVQRAFSNVARTQNANARVVWQGHLWCLKRRKAVRRWKRYWVVLRPQGVTLYKDEEVRASFGLGHLIRPFLNPFQEYSALQVLPTASILDVVDTETLSKSKKYCLQVITEDRSHRFCAAHEDDLSSYLGAIKSVLRTVKATKPNGVISSRVLPLHDWQVRDQCSWVAF